jgi:hypothetical protein
MLHPDPRPDPGTDAAPVRSAVFMGAGLDVGPIASGAATHELSAGRSQTSYKVDRGHGFNVAAGR